LPQNRESTTHQRLLQALVTSAPAMQNTDTTTITTASTSASAHPNTTVTTQRGQ
jgi:hypothetical protein